MHLTVEREIRRSASDVFAYFSDAANNPQWQEGMQRCEWTSSPPIGVGSTYEQKARFAGRDIISTFVVSEFDGERITIITVNSTFPIQVTRTVEPIDSESCRVRAEISGGPEKGFLRVIEPLMRSQAEKSIGRDYDRLVALLQESSDSSDSTENSPSE